MLTIEPDTIYTFSEVSHMLEIGRNKLIAAIRDGEIKAIPAAQSKFLFRGCNVVAYLKRVECRPVEEPPVPAPEQRKPRNVIRHDSLWEHSRKCLKAS